MSDRYSENRERIKQRNIDRHAKGLSLEQADPREQMARNIDPEVQAEVDALRLSDEEKAKMVGRLTASALRDQNRAQEGARDDS